MFKGVKKKAGILRWKYSRFVLVAEAGLEHATSRL